MAMKSSNSPDASTSEMGLLLAMMECHSIVVAVDVPDHTRQFQHSVAAR